ncbi:hypothetical protein Mgra_00008732, partial [Meloidogyne graminicola]
NILFLNRQKRGLNKLERGESSSSFNQHTGKQKFVEEEEQFVEEEEQLVKEEEHEGKLNKRVLYICDNFFNSPFKFNKTLANILSKKICC